MSLNRKFPRHLSPSLLAFAMALSFTGLAHAQEGATRSADDTNPRAGATGTNASQNSQAAMRGNANALDDGQILQVVRTLNLGEIAQAELAIEESDNAQVKEVAEMILADHTSSNEQIDMLEEQVDDLDLDDSDLSESLTSLAEETREGLADLDGAAFDCAYLQKQTELHQLALTTVSTQLMPAAQDAQVQALLSMSSPKLEHHQAMAEGALQGLSGCANAQGNR